MEGVEDAVKEQLDAAYSDLQAWLRREDAPDAELAAAFGRLGELLHVYKLYEAAEASYKNAAALAPDEPLYTYYLADIYKKTGRLEEAAEAYRRILEIAPDFLPARVHLAQVLLAGNQAAEARTELEKALAVDPESPGAHAVLGEVALSQKDYAQAAENLAFALERVPAANRLHYPLAMAYRGLGEMEKAREHLRQSGAVGLKVPDPWMDALEKLATGERVHLLRGRQAFAAGRYAEAAEEFRQAVAADPRSARALVNLGSALGQMGDIPGAMVELRKALEVAPGNFTAHLNLALLLASQGWDEEAVLHFQAALEANYTDSQAHLEMGRALQRLGRLEEAEKHLREAWTMDPASAPAHLAHAALLVQMKRYAEAVERLDWALERMPHEASLTWALARVLEGAPDPEVRDPQRAYDLVEGLFQADPRSDYALLAARALADLDRCEEAAKLQESVARAADEAGKADQAAALRKVAQRYAAGPPCRGDGGSGGQGND